MTLNRDCLGERSTDYDTEQRLERGRPVADPGGGPGGQDPPLLCHDVGFLTLGPKLDPRLPPPLFAGRPNLDPPPLSKILDPPL